MTRHNSRARDRPPRTIFSIHENGGFGERRPGKWYGRVVARRLRGARDAFPLYFRNCENVGGMEGTSLDLIRTFRSVTPQFSSSSPGAFQWPRSPEGIG